MRKTIAILLLLLFTAQTEWGQLFRLPFAVQHFIKHQQKNNGLSLKYFLLEHYNTNHQDDDRAADRQLPFNNYNSQIISLVYVPAMPPEASFIPAPTSQKPFTIFTVNEPCRRSFSIFHPPQYV